MEEVVKIIPRTTELSLRRALCHTLHAQPGQDLEVHLYLEILEALLVLLYLLMSFCSGGDVV